MVNLERLRAFLSEDDGVTDIHLLMEWIWREYLQHNPVDQNLIEEKLQQLAPMLKSFSRKRIRRFRYVVEELCMECERKTFYAGIRIGAQITLQLINMHK